MLTAARSVLSCCTPAMHTAEISLQMHELLFRSAATATAARVCKSKVQQRGDGSTTGFISVTAWQLLRALSHFALFHCDLSRCSCCCQAATNHRHLCETHEKPHVPLVTCPSGVSRVEASEVKWSCSACQRKFILMLANPSRFAASAALPQPWTDVNEKSKQFAELKTDSDRSGENDVTAVAKQIRISRVI